MRERVATTTRTYLDCLRIPRATLPTGREVGWAERLTATPIRSITPDVIPQIYGRPPGSNCRKRQDVGQVRHDERSYS